jgi:uncharacterized membrane protein AbrB (regulator of aidB expression)
MRARPLSLLVIATLLLVSILGVGVAEAQLDTGESYWGEQMINGIFDLWPAVAIAILTGLLAGGVFGFYELDATTMLVLLAASAFLAYHFYWQPTHSASVQLPDLGRLRSPRVA